MTYDDSKQALVDTSNSFVWKTDTGGMFNFLFTIGKVQYNLNSDILILRPLK